MESWPLCVYEYIRGRYNDVASKEFARSNGQF